MFSWLGWLAQVMTACFYATAVPGFVVGGGSSQLAEAAKWFWGLPEPTRVVLAKRARVEDDW